MMSVIDNYPLTRVRAVVLASERNHRRTCSERMEAEGRNIEVTRETCESFKCLPNLQLGQADGPVQFCFSAAAGYVGAGEH